MPDTPTVAPTAKLIRHTETIVDTGDRQESVDLAGSNLADIVAVITAHDPAITTFVGVAADHARPRFVSIFPVTAATVGESLCVESYGDQRGRYQLSCFASSAAGSEEMRADLLAAFAATASWMLADTDIGAVVDETLHPKAWMTTFTVRVP